MRKADICDRLRLAPAKLIGTVDEDTYRACHEAAGEIERLRQHPTLTRREVDVIAWAGFVLPSVRSVLEGLLERRA